MLIGLVLIGYGNYPPGEVKVTNSDTEILIKEESRDVILKTGQTSYTKSNNIYDLAGNCGDFTQEAFNRYGRTIRGAFFVDDYINFWDYPSSRTSGIVGSEDLSSRPCFYIR